MPHTLSIALWELMFMRRWKAVLVPIGYVSSRSSVLTFLGCVFRALCALNPWRSQYGYENTQLAIWRAGGDAAIVSYKALLMGTRRLGVVCDGDEKQRVSSADCRSLESDPTAPKSVVQEIGRRAGGDAVARFDVRWDCFVVRSH